MQASTRKPRLGAWVRRTTGEVVKITAVVRAITKNGHPPILALQGVTKSGDVCIIPPNEDLKPVGARVRKPRETALGRSMNLHARRHHFGPQR